MHCVVSGAKGFAQGVVADRRDGLAAELFRLSKTL